MAADVAGYSTVAAFVRLAMIRIMLRRLTNLGEGAKAVIDWSAHSECTYQIHHDGLQTQAATKGAPRTCLCWMTLLRSASGWRSGWRGWMPNGRSWLINCGARRGRPGAVAVHPNENGDAAAWEASARGGSNRTGSSARPARSCQPWPWQGKGEAEYGLGRCHAAQH